MIVDWRELALDLAHKSHTADVYDSGESPESKAAGQAWRDAYCHILDLCPASPDGEHADRSAGCIWCGTGPVRREHEGENGD